VTPENRVRETLLACWQRALDAVAAGPALARSLEAEPPATSERGDGPVFLLALGKAAAPMATVAEAWLGHRLALGLVVTKDGHGDASLRSTVLESAHPVPDARSERAGRAVLALAEALPPDARLQVLLSGGASSLLTCPLPGLTLEDLAATTRRLLAAGADIDELNTVRKHLTAVSGGRLARAAAGHPIDVRVVSDVPGDRLDVIASGPCSADPSTFAEALGVLRARGHTPDWPAAVRAHLDAGVAGRADESVKPGDPVLQRVRQTIVAANADARQAALAEARRRGLDAVDLGECLAGEAREAARALCARARADRGARPRLLVAGGETTVTVRGDGRGGRSQELALAAALELEGDAGIALLAAGTDGTDGPTDAAGALADPETAARGRARGLDPARSLARNDSHPFFAREGGAIHTGPTGTNVMDLVLIFVEPIPARTPPDRPHDRSGA
jgi:glycerate-2-kinase